MTEVRKHPAHAPEGTGGLITAVAPGSLAELVGLRPGDRLLAIDGRPLRDVVDYRFLITDDRLDLTVLRPGEGLQQLTITKHPDEELGLEFEDATFDGIRTCNNKCFFCFLKGLPRGLRRTLYVKDDDYRLSFFHGNFVTLTNLTEEDWARLEEQRLSPLNISVHATELELRRFMLGNKTAPDILEQIRCLGRIGIRCNTQVVLCPGVNDGTHLDRTIQDLAALYPTVQSIAVVPVGATTLGEERIIGIQGYDLPACTPAYARQIIRQLQPYQRAFRKRWGVTFVHAADEYYLMAGIPVPSARRYDGYPQFEDGIGITRAFIDDWKAERCRLRRRGAPQPTVRRVTFVCGTLIARTLLRLAAELEEALNIDVTVRPIVNRFFGPRVNVSGLLVAADIIDALAGRELGDLVFFSRSVLDYSGARFLDDGTPDQVQKALGVPIAFAPTLTEVVRMLTAPVRYTVYGASRNAASTAGKAWS